MDWFSPAELTAIGLSLKVAMVAALASLPLGVAVAWLLARRRFPGKALLDALVHLPLVLPPVVMGYALLVMFGNQGPIGGWLRLVFTFVLPILIVVNVPARFLANRPRRHIEWSALANRLGDRRPPLHPVTVS